MMGCLPVQSYHWLRDSTGVLYGVSYSIFPDGFVLTPWWYVDADNLIDDSEPFEEMMGRLAARAAGNGEKVPKGARSIAGR